jgi:DNA-binding Lrp family transcriptional regulator
MIIYMPESAASETDELLEILRAKLGLRKNAAIEEEQASIDSRLPYTVDFVVKDEDKTYFVETKNRANVDEIAHFILLKELLKKEGKESSHFMPVIAAKIIPPREEELAKELGIQLIQLPRSFKLESAKSAKSTAPKKKVKISSEKAWKVISRLLKEKMTSIRQLSILENVSYGWAHATVQSLIEQGIVKKKGNYVSISDTNKLLNGLAWERPLKNLLAGEIITDYEDAAETAKEISHVLKKQGVNFAFTSYTAGGLYTGYAVRHDAVYLYLEKDDLEFLRESFGRADVTKESEGKGVKVYLYVPDRDVFSDTGEIEGIKVVSPSQVLLDLAGLGYGGMDMAKAVLENYASL